MEHIDLFGKRVEYNPKFKFFDEKDYEGLHAVEASFISNNKNLYGKFYYITKEKYNSVVVLSHGFGGGHKAYSQEINALAQAGFIVFGFDNYGTAQSEGESIISVSSAIESLNDAINYVKSIKELATYEINLLGHSMGGYSVGCVLQFHKEIKHAVIMAAPNDFLTSFMKLVNVSNDKLDDFRKKEENHKAFSNLNLIDSLTKVTTKVLMIYGELDPVIGYDQYELLHNALSNNSNIEFVLEKGKFHNPNYSLDAINYASEKGLFLIGPSEKDFNDVDFKRVSAQDSKVINKIINFLK